MDVTDVDELLEDLRSPDREIQGRAFEVLMAATDSTVDRADDARDCLVADLGHGDDRTRAIAAQLLCNLARSVTDEQKRDALPALLRVTNDKRFVTARRCLQSLRKAGTPR